MSRERHTGGTQKVMLYLITQGDYFSFDFNDYTFFKILWINKNEENRQIKYTTVLQALVAWMYAYYFLRF